MNNTYQMDKFIKFYASLYYQNPDVIISPDTIYDALTKYGLSPNEINNSNIRSIFSSLEEKFRGNSNIKVYIDNRQSKFLQFRNWNRKDGKCVKMYVSYPKEYIEEAATKIFSYISQNNMETASKIAERLRSDSIVIRLSSLEDANKVRNFINNDKELVSLAKPTNPFSLKDGVVGIGYDDKISYNEQVGYILSNYFNDLRKGNNLAKASLIDFANYVKNYYQDTFVNCSKLEALVDNPIFKRHRSRFYSIGQEINNHEQITRLIVDVVNGKVNINMFNDYYNECCNESKNNSMIAYYNNIYESKVNSKKPIFDKQKLLNEYIIYAINKYGINNAYKYLEEYINGNSRAITRDNGFRILFNEHLSPSELSNIVGPDVKLYINNLIHINEVSNEVSNEKMTETEKYNLFYEACKLTIFKYGYYHLCGAIKNAMQGNYKFFTNGGKNIRQLLKNNIEPSSIISYCRLYLIDKGYNIANVNNIIETFATDLNKEKNNEQNPYNY